MDSEITCKAYAKINFGLRVLPKREDGFHNLESIFQTIDLYDELIVTPTTTTGCVIQCDSMELPENNTLVAAYNAFCDLTRNHDIGIFVKLIKGIPSGGGLGGGSSDAAALIRVLEKLCGTKLTDTQLDYIASKVGSDVFFFMHCDDEGRGCALVSGRGEIVKKIIPRKDLYLLLIFPEARSSTKEAYALIDQAFATGNKVKSPELRELEAIYNSPLEDWTFINTFTPVIAKSQYEIAKAINDIQRAGCCYTEMSGSGSTVYGAFTLKHQAEEAMALLPKTWNCKLVQVV